MYLHKQNPSAIIFPHLIALSSPIIVAIATSIFHKESIIIEDISPSNIKKGIKPLEQRLIVSF